MEDKFDKLELKENDEKLRKYAKKILNQKNIHFNKKRTHLFMHEKNLSKIVCIPLLLFIFF